MKRLAKITPNTGSVSNYAPVIFAYTFFDLQAPWVPEAWVRCIARDTWLRREVAVKVLPESFASDADRLLRFEQEARAVGALSHPNILMVHDIGDGRHRSRVQRVQRLGGHLRTRDITPIERLSHRSVPGLRRVHQTLDPPYLLQLSPLQSPSQGGDEQTSS